MALHREKEDALLAWINSFRLADPVDRISLLHDGILVVKLIYKLKEQENEAECPLDQPIQERLEFVSDFLQKYCRYKPDRGAIVSWDNILNGKNLEVELSKVVMLLMYHTIMNDVLGTDKLDYKTEFQMAAILRFVLNNEDSLYLSENLEKFLKKPFTVRLSSTLSSSISSDEESPIFNRRWRPHVQFLELTTVASSSAGSPIQDVLNTPQFQLRRVHKQLAQERDMRDELERELANSNQIITEREIQVSQLHQKLQRLQRDNAEQDQEPKELEELQNKNEGLLKRLHEVLKQYQDLKTNNGQMEKKIDQLTGENGNLSVHIRDVFARLSSAQTTVGNLSEEQEASQAEWESKKMFLETELCRAVSEKESLSEQIKILQGKISILEDELKKAQTQEQGEVLGPIMEWERLKQEVAELTGKLSQLQETIVQLEQEKGEIQTQHQAEKTKFESETSHLQGLIFELQQTLCDLRVEREGLEQTSRDQQAAMTAQIEALNVEIACLSEMIHQKEVAVSTLSQQMTEEQSQRGKLKEVMEKQDQINQETIQGLSQRVDYLGSVLKLKEEEALSNADEWNRNRRENTLQHAMLQEESERATRERDTILVEYHQFRQEKDVEVINLTQQVRRLEEQREVEVSFSSKLRKEKGELEFKLVSLESAIRDLQKELELESRKHKETLASKLQKESQMGSEILELGNKVQQLVTEIELMGQQLNETRQEKCHAQSCVEKLTIECREVSNTLSVERDHVLQTVKESEAEVKMLCSKINMLNNKLIQAEGAKAIELAKKMEEIEKLEKEKEQALVELEALTTEKGNLEAHFHLDIEKHQAELCKLRLELTDMQGLMKQKETEKELLQNEMSTKEEEMKTQREHVLCLQSETAQMKELKKNLVENKTRSQMAEQESDAKNEEVQLLRTTLAQKEDKINIFQQSIQSLEEKIYSLQDVHNQKTKEYEQSISALELSLAEGQVQIGEKSAAFEIQAQHVLNAQKDLSLEQARVVSLESKCKQLEQNVSRLQAQVLQASTLTSEREAELNSLQTKVQQSDNVRLKAVENEEFQRRELEQKVAQLQAEVLAASTLASDRESKLITLQNEVKERDNLRLQVAEAEKAQRKELEQKVAQLQAKVQEASTLASEKEAELVSLQNEVKERDNLKHQVAETEEAQCKELDQKVGQLQAQVLAASTLASDREFKLISLQNEVKEKDNLRFQVAETEKAQRKELEQKVAQLQAQVQEASTLASEKEAELVSLQNEVKESDNLRHQVAETEEAQRKELDQKVGQLQAQVLAASTLASDREFKLISLQNEVKEKDNLRFQVAETEKAQRKELEQKVAQLQAQVQEASTLASEKEAELVSLQNEVKERDNLKHQVAETEEVQCKELDQKVGQLQAQVLAASTLASDREFKLISLQNEVKEKDNLRFQVAETEKAQRKELEQKVAQLQAQVQEASTLASEKEAELVSLQNEVKESDNLRHQVAETEEAQRKELDQKVGQLQAQVLAASTLASVREFKLISLQNEVKEKDNLRFQVAETEKAQRKELEQKVAQLQAQVQEASTLASEKEAELVSLQNEVKESDNLRHQVAETEEAQRKELEQKVAQLQAKVQEASTLASEKEAELVSLQNEVKERDNLRHQVAETEEAQRKEFERRITKLDDDIRHAASLAVQKQQVNETLKEELKKSNAEKLERKEMEKTIADLQAKLICAFAQQEHTADVQEQIASLRHKNEELLSTREELQKERDDLDSQLQIVRGELSTLHPLREVMAERSLFNHDLQEQLSVKSEALEHYKVQMEKAKIHYNGKKQQLLEANEKVHAIAKALETSEQEVKTLKEQMKVLQLELEQANGLQKDLILKVNSLQAQLDYADRHLREQSKLGKCEEKAKETVCQKVTEKQQDISEDSLDLSLDDTLNSNRRPSKRKESSTPMVRSSERLQARRRARGDESLETLFFTPMSSHNIVDRKLEGSITSLGDLVLDSAKKSHSARRRTTQVINITMTKKTPGKVQADAEEGSFYSLQSAQSYPNLTTQRGRPFSLEFSEEATVGDQLRHLPGYRRSTASSAAPTRSISTFRVGAENEPEHSQDWMRIAELQARNQACLPHLKSSYPIESRQESVGKPLFVITDDDLRTGDPNETIRRASMMPSQIQDSLASHRLSMLPGQIRDDLPSHRGTMLPSEIGSGTTSHRAVLQPKQYANNAQNGRAATLPLKRSSGDLQGPDTPEAKKLSSCFPRPMTPKDWNDRRLTLQNSQNRHPGAPTERRQSMMFSVENTPKKNGKSSLLQKGINRMRASTRKSPGSTSKIPRSTKSPHVEKSQRRSPRIASNKSPKIASSARKIMSYKSRMKM